MFTAKPQKNRGAATTYFDEHLSHNDYYTQGDTRAGYWFGEGAKKLGLAQRSNVSREAFLRLCDNQHPQTGKKLTQLQLSSRRIFFDFTCSAPKSVSIMAVTMGDERISGIHREAVAVAIKELEQFAATRVRRDGAMEDRNTGNLIGAAFQHTSSRALDPQLHTHCTLFNATFDKEEQRWKALQTVDMFAAIKYGTAIYRNELARGLHAIGYKTRSTANAFEIEGVPQDLIERFSKRSKQRDEIIARREARLGRRLTKAEISHIVHKSRDKKLKNVSEEAVREQQLGELGFFEKRGLANLIKTANGTPVKIESPRSESFAVHYALAHVFERKSVQPEHAILEAALVYGRGQVELPTLKSALEFYGDLVHVGRDYSTRGILEAELSMIRLVNQGLDSREAIAPRFVLNPRLGPDQCDAVALVLGSKDLACGLQGLAGTGKTTALKELDRAFQASGYQAIYCAPSAAASEVLRSDGLKAQTLAKFLEAEQPLNARSVVVLDEAGTLGAADMLRLLERVQAAGARVVFSGDTRQHSPVAQGDALRVLEEHSGYRYGRLSQIRRQTREDLRKIVSLASEQKCGEAFQALKAQGEVVEASAMGPEAQRADGLYPQVAAAYLQATKEKRAVLIVSPTWDEIGAVTKDVRAALKTAGRLSGNEEDFGVFDSFAWTQAQKGNASDYEPGMRLRFVRKTEHFKPGDCAEVVAVSGKRLTVRRVFGEVHGDEVVSLDPSRAPSSFDVGQAQALPVAAGDWLLLQANAKNQIPGKRPFVNGERVRVKTVEFGRIVLEDGRQIPPGYRTFTHGYALTSHAAQGKTVDEVLLVASSRSFSAMSQEGFYVGISRARDRTRVFTDDIEGLGERVRAAHTRKAAIELDGLRELASLHGLLKAPKEIKVTPPKQERIQREDPSRALRLLRPIRRLRTHLRLSAAAVFAALAQGLTLSFGLHKHRSILKQTPTFANEHTNPSPQERPGRRELRAQRRLGATLTPPSVEVPLDTTHHLNTPKQGIRI